MNEAIDLVHRVLAELFALGAGPKMFFFVSVLAIVMGAKVSKAIEGGLKLAIAMTGVGVVIRVLIGNFAPALAAFATSTGLSLQMTDVGWAPLATITWGSAYTLFFLFVLITVNLLLLALNQTQTLDLDIFNVWHLSFTGLLVFYYSDSLFLSTLFVVFLCVLKSINADLMKPTFNDLLDMSDGNPTTTTHLNFLINPVLMVVDQLVSRLFPSLDRYDFDARTLNEKIGFWGSRFAIGIYMGLFVGLLANYSIGDMLQLALISALSLELFAVIGKWFVEAIEPISQAVTDFLNKRRKGRSLHIGIDWPFLSARPEIWAVANLLAPVLIIMALVLPGNHVLPLGGIILTSLAPALLVICRGKIIRMLLTGSFVLPLFLWSATAIAPFVTAAAQSVGAMPVALPNNPLITHSTMGGPVEKFLAILIGRAGNGFVWQTVLWAVVATVFYLILFAWYVKQMKKRNAVYAEKKNY